jgi:hypothetical protein
VRFESKNIFFYSEKTISSTTMYNAGVVFVTLDIWSQSYDFDLQRHRCKFFNATGSLARFENKHILFYFVKHSGRRIDSW